MIKFENTEVLGLSHAIRGMRNPKNSWDKSDSWKSESGHFYLGDEDRKLAMTLANAGTDHGKFLRFIEAYVDITAPIYWWKEADTYRMGKEQNSCSTMYKLAEKPIEIFDFSIEHLNWDSKASLQKLIDVIEENRKLYVESGDKTYWWQMIQLLPSSYNQRRTVMISYSALRHMYHARKNHKLNEWREMCRWIETLPYAELITGKVKEDAGQDD